MIIEVLGLQEFDSGKTLFSQMLIRGMRDLGLRFVPFKPIAGYNVWRQFEHFKLCFKEGMFYSYDLYRLKKVCGCMENPQILNPICILTSPLKLKEYIEVGIKGQPILRESFSLNFLTGRITKVEGSTVKNTNYFIKNKFRRLLMGEEVLKLLRDRKEKVEFIEDYEEFTDLIMKRSGMEAINTCFSYISKKYNNIIIEGFNDVLLPWSGLRADIPIIVSPGYAFVFDKDKFISAIEALLTIRDVNELRTEDLVNLVSPENVYRYPLRFGDDVTYKGDDFNRLLDHILKFGGMK
ncbi:MAG: hypothetical protein J7L50_00365 [Candidatus Odinarchaeota archaeon]|nr:hypothetical protein [Candidatus Odinarchaeota archaeon]